MFMNSYYQLHLDIINSLINALKLERMRLQDESNGTTNYGRYSDTIYSDILAMLRLPLITP